MAKKMILKRAELEEKTNASESWGEANEEEPLTKTPKYYCSVTDYDFKFLGNGRQIDRNLTVQNLGVLHGTRVWPWSITSPPCLIRFYPDSVKNEVYPRKYVTLTYNYFDHDNSFVRFGEFLDHIKAVGDQLKKLCAEKNYDVSKWRDPEVANDGTVEGLRVRVKLPHVIKYCEKHSAQAVCCVIKLSSLYFTRERSGLSFELIEVITEEDMNMTVRL